MDEDFSDSSGPVFLPDDHIRSAQANLQAQLEGFRKTSPDVNFIETQNVCENVKDKILNSEDDSQLSKIHNNSRRISIASELFIGICSLYSFIVDCEFTKIIDALIQWKKYDYISKKITHKMRSELKREKYFEREAQSKLQKSIQADKRTSDGPEEIPKPAEGIPEETATRDAVTQEEKRPQKEQEIVEAAEVTQIDEISKVMGLTSEHSTRDEIPNTTGNITLIRAESPIDHSLLHLPTADLETEMHSIMTSIPEIPIQETSFRGKGEADINKILQILEGDIVEREMGEMAVPETFLETTAAVGEPAENMAAEKSSTHGDGQMDQFDIEEWELPDVEHEKITKKKYPVIIDKIITIHNYSERALYMNSNIKIERVQVFEGPPKVLQAMSATHLMKTSGFKSSFFQDVRSSKLNKLFERHLTVEKKPVESITLPLRGAAKAMQEIRLPGIRPSEEQVEDIAARAGMYSLPGRGDVLAEVEKEKSHFEQTEISVTGAHAKESLIGMPLSRIISPTAVVPPDLDKINTAAISYTPRVQELQGQSLDPEMHSSWFHSTKKNPPIAKYREFNYVYNKIQEYWAIFEVQGMKKSITLREFFAFEMDGNAANFLTLLRILDKLSIQRKLLLKYENPEVVIQPFESPFVSEKQLQIKGKEPIL